MTNNKNKKNAALFVIASAVIWGTTGTSQALAPSGATPLAIGAVRLSLGGLILLTLVICKGSFKGVKNWPILPTIAAAVSIALYQPFFFGGVSKTGVAVGTIVAIGSSPVFAGILGYLFRGEKPGSKWFIATGFAIIGNILLLLSENDISLNSQGIVMALGAGLAYSMYSLTSKKLLESYPVELVVAIILTLGSILLSPFIFTQDLGWLINYRGLAVALHLGIFTIAIAYTLYSQGLKRIPVAEAVTLTLAEPLTATMLGVFLLGEKINLLAGIGITLLFMGIVILSINFNEKRIETNGRAKMGG